MTAYLVVVLMLLFVGIVLYAGVLLWSSATQRATARLRQAHVLREQFLAEQRLQTLTRSAMQQMLDAARQSRQDKSG